MKHPRLLLTPLLLLGFTVQSHAELLFSNLGQTGSGTLSFNNPKVRYATDFRTDNTARTVNSVTALMDNSDSSSHVVSFSIFTDDGGAPGTLVLAFATPALLPAGASGIFTVTSAGVSLLANTPYWLIGQADEYLPDGGVGPQNPNVVNWHYSSSHGTDGGPFSTVPTTSIQGGVNGTTTYAPETSGNLMYALSMSEVPEPSSLVLMTIAGTAGALGRRRRGKA